MFDILINKVQSILKANTDIGEVYIYEASSFSADPVAVVVPSSNSSDYNTTEENVRIYAFTIRLFVKRTAPRKPEDADQILRDLVSSVINAFDKDYTFSGIQATLPAGYTFINSFALPSSWGYSGEREDEFRVAELNLQCRVSVDLGAIT